MVRGYSSDEKKNIKIYPDTLDLLRELRRGSESYDDVLRRELPTPEADLSACDGCGAAVVEPVIDTDTATLCGRCADGE
jgi:hypothetical protein